DGNACTTGDACSNGRCTGGPARSCDDGNVCTIDSCDPATGCVHAPNTAPCDDGSACTTNDTCSGGTCVGGPPLICPTGVPVPATAGAVAQGQAVDFDVTGAIHGDGVYCFALDTPSTDSALYNSREATAGKPEVAVTAVCPCGAGPTMTTTTSTTTSTTLPAIAPVAAVVADTYVQSDKPTTNFGTKTYLAVDNGSPSAPGGAGVQRALLRVSVSGVGTRRV